MRTCAQVFPDGRIQWQAGAARTGGELGHWLSLDGISFAVKVRSLARCCGPRPLYARLIQGTEEWRQPLSNDWVDFGHSGFQGARYFRDGEVHARARVFPVHDALCAGASGLCVVSGLIRSKENTASASNTLLTLVTAVRGHACPLSRTPPCARRAPSAAPRRASCRSCSTTTTCRGLLRCTALLRVRGVCLTVRPQVLPSGDVVYASGERRFPHISLTGLVFFPTSAPAVPGVPQDGLVLEQAFVPASEGSRAPSIVKYQELCVLSGRAEPLPGSTRASRRTALAIWH